MRKMATMKTTPINLPPNDDISEASDDEEHDVNGMML
jgi:hypothetical protein